MHPGSLVGVDRLHQVDLDLERPDAHHGDVFVHVLGLAAIAAGELEPERVDPEAAQSRFVETADGDLLHAQDREGSFGDGGYAGHSGHGGPV